MWRCHWVFRCFFFCFKLQQTQNTHIYIFDFIMLVIPIREVNFGSPDVLSMIFFLHWNRNVILTKFSPLAVLKVVKITTFGEASDENFVKQMIFLFQCNDVDNLWGHILYLFYQVTCKPSEPMTDGVTYVAFSLISSDSFHVTGYIRKGSEDMHGHRHIVNEWNVSEFFKCSKSDLIFQCILPEIPPRRNSIG